MFVREARRAAPGRCAKRTRSNGRRVGKAEPGRRLFRRRSRGRAENQAKSRQMPSLLQPKVTLGSHHVEPPPAVRRVRSSTCQRAARTNPRKRAWHRISRPRTRNADHLRPCHHGCPRKFFARTPARIERRSASVSYEPVYLPDGLDFLMRPVLRGMCRFESLKDGSLDLCDVALMNEALDVMDENASRAQEASKARG